MYVRLQASLVHLATIIVDIGSHFLCSTTYFARTRNRINQAVFECFRPVSRTTMSLLVGFARKALPSENPLLPWLRLERVFPSGPTTQLGHPVCDTRGFALFAEVDAGVRHRSDGSNLRDKTGMCRAQAHVSPTALVDCLERMGASRVRSRGQGALWAHLEAAGGNRDAAERM